MVSGYDLIGDIHGQAGKLEALLIKMGYAMQPDGYYAHPDRMAVLLADFIDRHPRQKEVLNIVRPMVDHGAALAVTGNHEFNAVCYATRGPSGGYIRPHTDKNTHQHQAFLDEFPPGSPEYEDQINWFKTLPVYLDLKDIFVIHACWDQASIDILKPFLNPDNTLTPQAYMEYADETTPCYEAIEMLLKGPEHALPGAISFHDGTGIQRHRSRISWWANKDLPTAQRLEFLPHKLTPDQVAHLNQTSITQAFNEPAKPVFIGHYWMTGTPAPLTEKIACVDYSAARNGDLVAYRWSGEKTLTAQNFIW